MQLISALWALASGKKFNTGTFITVLATVFQASFKQFGIEHDESVVMATYLVQGSGVLIMVIGYIHRLVKSRKAPQIATVQK